MKTFSGRPASQRGDELQRFITILRRLGSTSYLEIGARHGDTFHAVMTTLPVESYGVAVDLPGGAWGQDGSQAVLERACNDLQARGYQTCYMLRDSADSATIDRIRAYAYARTPGARFDACLIDGDHRYDAVMRDFRAYSKLARIVALHDIAGEGILQKKSRLPVEVPLAWAEIRQMGFPTAEIIGAERGMGIGLVCMDPDLAALFTSMTAELGG